MEKCNYHSQGDCAGKMMVYSRDDGSHWSYCNHHFDERLDAQRRDEEAMRRAEEDLRRFYSGQDY